MSLKSILLTLLGFIFLALGTIGLFLPIWPTTPFVLLSAACFSGMPRIRGRIMKIGFFREHIENYDKRTGLSPKITAISLTWLWSMLLLSILLVRRPLISLLLATIGIAVTVHILLMARARPGKGEGGR